MSVSRLTNPVRRPSAAGPPPVDRPAVADKTPSESSPTPPGPSALAPAPAAAPRLLDRARERIRFKHYSIRTEQAYLDWIKRYIHFHGKRHPEDMAAVEVESFLSHLAIDRLVSAATQNQAKSALLFLYKEVLGTELPWLDDIEQAKTPARLPVVLTHEEVAVILRRLDGVHRLLGRLLYGTGMRIMEAVRLRVKDVEFSRHEIVIRDGKGAKDRMAMLPRGIAGALRWQIDDALDIHRRDLEDGYGGVWLPYALAHKYRNAQYCSGWQYVFPGRRGHVIHAVASSVGITFRISRSSGRCAKRCATPA